MTGPASQAANAYEKVSNWLSPASSVIDEILRPLVEPMAEWLECVTGDPEGLLAAAEVWKDRAGQVREVIADQRRDRAALQHDWQGEASDRLQAELEEFEKTLEEEADAMEQTAFELEEAAEQCRVAQELVETVIRELIEMLLISLAASLAMSVLTAGISMAAEAAVAAGEAGIASARIAGLVARLATALKRLEVLMKAKKASILKPSTFKDPELAQAFVVQKVAKKTIKAGLHGIGLTGDPIGQTAQTAVQEGLKYAADEVDQKIHPQGLPPTVELTPEERRQRFDQAFG
ncbi:WXG100 family type VII secretion target [Kitasatospora sp. NBC_00070]|uniref:WXG100 family type VII secretion target n=1 Tax=Kitasatospora sp. NBC_00070 TaxID=2975962 RepID=UPI00324E52E0